MHDGQAAGTDQMAPPAKLLGLELVRFTCALAVLVWHFHHFAMIGDRRLLDAPHEPLRWLFAPFYDFGKYGVQVFWSISGFIFFWKYADALAARAIDARRFFWLRFSRLYPLHLATLLVVAAVQPIYAALSGDVFVFKNIGLLPFVKQLFLADQWFGAAPFSFNGPIWSVSAEVVVYAAFFLTVRMFGKSGWLFAAAIGMGLVSLWSGAPSPTVICGAYFFAGGLAAEAWRDARRRALWQALSIVILFVGALTPFVVSLGEDRSNVLHTWLLVMAPPMILLAARDWKALDRFHHVVQAAGNLTYSTYLIHFPLQLLMVTTCLAVGIVPPVGEAWFLLAYLAVSLALGRIIFLHYERPAQRLIRAATLRPGPVAATA